MAGHQVTHGCSKVGRVGNSSPSLSDSRYLVDRFTPVLNDHSLSHYTLASGCAWGRCEIVAVCHVHRPCVVPVSFEVLLQWGDRVAVQPSCCLVCFCVGCCPLLSCALTASWSRGSLLVILLFWRAAFKVLVRAWNFPICSLFWGHIYTHIPSLDRINHCNPLPLGCLLSECKLQGQCFSCWL